MTNKNKSSPNPSGCPPMRTIFHSSPEALVKSTLFGNLQHKAAQSQRSSLKPQPGRLPEQRPPLCAPQRLTGDHAGESHRPAALRAYETRRLSGGAVGSCRNRSADAGKSKPPVPSRKRLLSFISEQRLICTRQNYHLWC